MIITIPLQEKASPSLETPEITQAAAEVLEAIELIVSNVEQKPILVIYDSDMDGYVSAMLFMLLLEKLFYRGSVQLWPLVHGADSFTPSETPVQGPVSIYDTFSKVGIAEVHTAIPTEEVLNTFGAIFVLDHAYVSAINQVANHIPIIYIDHHPTITPVEDRVGMITATFTETGCVASTTGIVGALLFAHTPGLRESVFRSIIDMVDYHDSWKYGTLSAADTLSRNFTTAFYACNSALALVAHCCDAEMNPASCRPGVLSSELNRVLNLGAAFEKEKAKIREQLVEDIFSAGELGIIFYRGDYDMIAKLAFGRGMCKTIVIASLRGDSVKCSVRSAEGAYITAKELSEELGGGGHMHSGGFVSKSVGDIVNCILQAYGDIQCRKESSCRL